jgi:hypothetical protein
MLCRKEFKEYMNGMLEYSQKKPFQDSTIPLFQD